MNYQQNFEGIQNFRKKFSARGIESSEKILLRARDYASVWKEDPQRALRELERINRLLKLEEIGKVELLEYAKEYYPENFMPTLWKGKVEVIKEDRPVYRFSALKRDGTKKKIMIKGPKITSSYLYEPPKEWISALSGVRAYKESRTEMNHLLRIRSTGVNAEMPLGIFENGIENYLYTEFVEGQNPLEILADRNMRIKFWEADAKLLAGLCKARIKHQGFPTSKFDDKVWSNGKLFLIDCDEGKDMLNNWFYKDYFRKNPKKLPGYFVNWLKDCIFEYQRSRVIKENEMITYAKVFLDELKINQDAGKVIGEIDFRNRTTEESYINMMCDCD